VDYLIVWGLEYLIKGPLNLYGCDQNQLS